MSARIDDMDATPADAERKDIALPPPGAPDIEIARAVPPQPILELAKERLGLPASALVPYGHFKAKLALAHIDS
ncbi:MAG TPA: hypothetical protein VFE85_04475, partial [Woeseiaceae bacterium]|nr:hypothetical protein [Woeseiaceae bacterium]